ncbi:hypothetical protein F2Q70_00043819 [Brassica cretica]|uniref:Uncharacterized protein n=1 Tax=Brassica cretica TaxID=69181 RepID=A0A8S9KHI5_BRACR|nr:hypothetical protein F2Q70_00043819 [Brassica cretica]
MANSFVLLADLNACQCSFTVEVRLLRSWKARNVKSCGKTYYLDQHQTGVITTTSYAGAGSSVGRCQPKILNISKSLTPRAITVLESGDRDRFWDSRLLTSAKIIQRDDGVGGGIYGEKTATVQITDDNLSNHPGASDATAAAEQPTSDRSNAEEQLVPAAGNALKSTHGLVA